MQLGKPYQSMQKADRNLIHQAGSREADKYLSELAIEQDIARSQ